ncbi:fungal-specific transcription factor domain-containing protein [Xylariaceae sp. FL1651]|nr:fungal-specific transcription factor domain-containing protein [Xylariaceae sp. FL1651]
MEDTITQSEQPYVAAVTELVTRACDICRRKKIRCEPTREGCAQCTKFKAHCHFTPIARKRKPRRPAGFKYIAELEAKLKNMEALLGNALNQRSLGGNNTSPNELMLRVGYNLGTRQDSLSEQSLWNNRVDALELPPQESTFAERNPGSALDLSSPFYTFNQASESIRLPHETFVTPFISPPFYTRVLRSSPFSMHPFQELPPKSVALELINDAFRSFFRFLPLFDEGDFLRQFQDRYSSSTNHDPAWWACLNAVLSLAHRFRGMRTLQTADDNSQAYAYLHNALGVVSELNMLHHSLPAIQALVCMAIILQGTPHPHIASVLIAAAVRLAQAAGLHRNSQDPNLSENQIEQRKRIFWMAYILDKDISLRTGQPFAQDDDDMDVELPRGTITKLPLQKDLDRTVNILNSRIGLAVIQGQIYKRLYSVQALQQSRAQRSALAQELSTILAYWRGSVPIDFEDNTISPLEAPLRAEFHFMLVLRFTYVSSLIMIDQHQQPTEQALTDATPGMQQLVAPSEDNCVKESRKAVRLIQVSHQGDYASVWIILHPFFAAATVLLKNVIYYPESLEAWSDIMMVQPFLQLLALLSSEKGGCSRSEEAQRMYKVCNDLNNKAKKAAEGKNRMIRY